VSGDSADRLCGFAVVKLQHAPEPLTAPDWTRRVYPIDQWARCRSRARNGSESFAIEQQPAAKPS
jgi:hypothetical protein